MSREHTRCVCFGAQMTSRSPYRLVHHFLEPCCQGDSNARDQGCLGSRQCCTLVSQNTECHQGILGYFRARALAGAHSLTAENDRSTPSGQSCLIPTGTIPDIENNVTAEDDCCSHCTQKCHPARGQVYPVDAGPAEKEDISTLNTRASI